VAYKLQLPNHSRIHPVVHVSQLKKALPPTSQVSSDEFLLSIHTDVVLVPKKILDTKLRQVRASASPVMLVQWRDYQRIGQLGSSRATWKLYMFQLLLQLEDKLFLREGEC
jgi:hypothetical protein